MPEIKTYSNPDRNTHIIMATNDLNAIMGSALLGGNLEANRQWLRDVAQELYNTHGQQAMQEVYKNVTSRYPQLQMQLSQMWDGIGDWVYAELNALLVIVRDSSFVAAAVPTIITLNGKQVCALKNGESARVPLTQRQNILLTNSVGSKNVRYAFEAQNSAVGELHVKGGVFLPKTMVWRT